MQHLCLGSNFRTFWCCDRFSFLFRFGCLDCWVFDMVSSGMIEWVVLGINLVERFVDRMVVIDKVVVEMGIVERVVVELGFIVRDFIENLKWWLLRTLH